MILFYRFDLIEDNFQYFRGPWRPPLKGGLDRSGARSSKALSLSCKPRTKFSSTLKPSKKNFFYNRDVKEPQHQKNQLKPRIHT